MPRRNLTNSVSANPLSNLPSTSRAPLLHRAQAADQSQQRCLARTGWPGHDDDFAGHHFQVVVEEHLLACFALAVIVVQMLNADEGTHRVVRACHGVQGELGIHQNTSAGSDTWTFRTASNPADDAHGSK